jgi:hypothetical protein
MFPPRDSLSDFVAGHLAAVCMDESGFLRINPAPPAALLPGSFNPVHEGHWQLAATASRILGCEIAFELSVVNVDKPPVASDDLRKRMAPFVDRAPVWLTRAPTFVEKARLFPKTVFVIGADTALRLVDPRYYGGTEAGLMEGLSFLASQQCTFLVACRTLLSGACLTLADLAVPAAFQPLFTAIPREVFDLPISSTALRALAGP